MIKRKINSFLSQNDYRTGMQAHPCFCYTETKDRDRTKKQCKIIQL